MPEVIFTGPAGRLEGRFHSSKTKGAPIAIILHPHPQFGGTMNNQIVYQLYYAFAERGFSVMRFNFRGVGRSQGAFDHGAGELSDAAAALDWAQAANPEAARVLDRGRVVWMLDWHAAPHAATRNRGFHLDRAAGQPLRLHVSCALPVVGAVRPRRSGPRRAPEGSHGPYREAEDAERHPHRTCGRTGRQPFLREPRGAADRRSRHLSRPAAWQSPRVAVPQRRD